MKPDIRQSQLTGQWYVVTRWSKPGVAHTQYDVTDQMGAILNGMVSLADVEKAVRAELDALRRRILAHVDWYEPAPDLITKAILARLTKEVDSGEG